MTRIVKRLKQELLDLNENPIENCSAGPYKDNLHVWQATIFGPTGTPYEGGVFNVMIEFGEKYPFKPPIVYFTTPIYHCNINRKGGICLDILNKSWSPVLTTGKLLISICSLLAEPNPEDPLVPAIANLYKTDRPIHDFKAREYTSLYASK